MKKAISPKLIFSAAILSLLLIGALINFGAHAQPAPPADANAAASADASATSGELPSDIPPNSPLAQVVRLAQSGVDESVILSYINNSGTAFNLTSDQIVYLKDLGLPNDAVTAMIQRDQQLGVASNAAPAPATEATVQTETPEQPVEVTQNYFYDTLSPYGGWVDVEGYGLCWRPTVVIYDSSWQPYCEHGHWVYTDAGWYWTSDYAWGACAFHYGRWFHDARFGWCWWPETTWGPSWVCWRYSNDYCGWAPLPPRCVYREGVGIVFNGAVVSAGFDFGIGVNFFTFVPTRNFCDPHPDRFRVPRTQAATVYSHTTVINNFNVNSHNHTVVNNGIAPDRISAVSKQPIHQVAIRDSTAPNARGEQLGRNGNTLIVNRPHIEENAVSTLNQGIKPPVVHQNTPRPLIINGNGNTPHTTVPQQNYFSQPRINQNPQPNHNVIAPQTPASAPPETPHITTPQTQPQRTFSQPITQPAPQTSGNNFNYNRNLSPRRQQFEDQSPRYNSRNFVQPVNPAVPAEHPQAVESHNESQSSSHVAPPAPATSAPSGPQKSGGDKNQNGPGH